MCRKPPGSNIPKWFKFDDGDFTEAKIEDDEVGMWFYIEIIILAINPHLNVHALFKVNILSCSLTLAIHIEVPLVIKWYTHHGD